MESLCDRYQNNGNYNFIQSLYWAVATGTTVGFGDLSPETDAGKWFCIFYLPIVIVGFVNFVGALQAKLKGEGSLEDILGLALNEELITQIDKSGDGAVSKDEWLRAVLVALGKADEDLCDLILEQFDNLDTTKDGLLSVDDFKGVFENQEKERAKVQQMLIKEKGKAYLKATAADRAKHGRLGAGKLN